MKVLHSALAGGLLVIGSAAVAAQEKPQMGSKPSNCEENISILGAATQAVDKEGLLIVIARLGDGEQNPELNRRRLHNVRTYLSQSTFMPALLKL